MFKENKYINSNFIDDLEELENTQIVEAFLINQETNQITSYKNFREHKLTNFFLENNMNDIKLLSEGILVSNEEISFDKL